MRDTKVRKNWMNYKMVYETSLREHTMSKNNHTCISIFILVFGLFLYIGCGGGSSSSSPAPEVGTEFSIMDLEGTWHFTWNGQDNSKVRFNSRGDVEWSDDAGIYDGFVDIETNGEVIIRLDYYSGQSARLTGTITEQKTAVLMMSGSYTIDGVDTGTWQAVKTEGEDEEEYEVEYEEDDDEDINAGGGEDDDLDEDDDVGGDGSDSTPAPSTTIDSPSGDVIIEEGESVNFQGSVSGGEVPFTYLWNFDGGASNVSVEDPGVVVFKNEGAYTVTFEVTDSTGISDPTPATVVVTVVPPGMDLLPGNYLFSSAGVEKDSCFKHDFDEALENLELLIFYIDERLVTVPGDISTSPDIDLPLSYYSNPSLGLTFNDISVTGIEFENIDNDSFDISADKIDNHKLVKEYACRLDFTTSGELLPVDSQTLEGTLKLIISDPKGCQVLAVYNPIFLGYGSCNIQVNVVGILLD